MCVIEPLVAVTVTVPLPVTEVPLEDELVCEFELLPPPPQPTIIPTATITNSASFTSLLFFDVRSRSPTIINPMAMANVPSVQGKKCGNSFGACNWTVRVVGAVTVTVAVPAVVSEVGDTVHLVPGSEVETLQVNEIAPVKPF